MKNKNYSTITLYEAILALKSKNDVQHFLSDLCTPAELKSFNERWAIAQLLYDGKLSYREISKQTNASTTTISRVARFLSQESYNGYKKILDKFKKRKK